MDAGSELVSSLMSGMSTDERERLLRMINVSLEAERSAALEGTVRRQVDVGVRRRRWSRRPAAAGDPHTADAEGGDDTHGGGAGAPGRDAADGDGAGDAHGM
jgi:hypothetical protein